MGAAAMANESDIVKHVERRLRVPSHEAEMIARARELLIRSEELLQSSKPTIFLGKPHARRTSEPES
jgi:hypothetical protein